MTITPETGAVYTDETLPTANPSRERRFPPLRIVDTGKVRIGGQGPCFRPATIADTGKVRVGGQGPIFR